MPTSSKVPSAAAPVEDRSPIASDSEEFEYEEIEIDEEIEVEEEVSDNDEEEFEEVEEEVEEEEFEEEEVEEEEEEEIEEEVEEEQEEEVEEEQEEEVEEEQEEEKGGGEDASQSIQDCNDVEMDTSDDKKATHSDGGILTAEITNPVNDSNKQVTVGDSVDDGIVTAEITNPINDSSKQATVGESVDKSDKVPPSDEQATQMETDLKEPRLDVDVTPQSLLPGIENHERNKKKNKKNKKNKKKKRKKNKGKKQQEEEKKGGADAPQSIEVVMGEEKIISDDKKATQSDGGIMTAEIANPIKESSKPVTVEDSADKSGKIPPSDEQTTQMEKEPRLDVGGTLIRPHSLSPGMEVNEGNKRPALVCEFFAKGWCIKGTSCRFRHIKDPPVDEPQKSQPQDEGVKESTVASTLIACSSEFKHMSHKDNPLSNLFMGPSTQRSSWASFAPKIEEGYPFGLHSYNPSHHGAVWPRTSTFLASSSWKSNAKKTGFDWDVSKPFRSTFLLSQGIYTPDIQYDPIRDSIEQPTKVDDDKLPKLSSSGRAPSISGTHSPILEQEKVKTECGSDRNSVGSHVNGNGQNVDSNEIADTKQENTKSESKGKRHIGDVIQASDVNASGHYSLQQNDDGPTKEVNNYKLDLDAEGDMHRESKSLRNFRAALIEFVKELVRPAWRDGRLSKDAHKLIVKKTVDKVLSSLPPEHVPNVKESIDTYLTSSQPKLMKLVEGYVEKYGKM